MLAFKWHFSLQCIVESQHYLDLAEHLRLMPSLWRTLSLSTFGSDTLGWMTPLKIERSNHFIHNCCPCSYCCLCTLGNNYLRVLSGDHAIWINCVDSNKQSKNEMIFWRLCSLCVQYTKLDKIRNCWSRILLIFCGRKKRQLLSALFNFPRWNRTVFGHICE